MSRRRLLLGAVVALVATVPAACEPDLGGRESLVGELRVLAVRAEPAEAKPGTAVTYSLLVATPAGPIASPVASWAFCRTPKRLTENGAASVDCLSTFVEPIAEGPPSVTAVVPADACGLFGPEVISADLRPRDPDVTGGFYQPVRVTAFDPRANGERVVAYGLSRLGCKLANAAATVASDFADRYRPNQNPVLQPVAATIDGQPAALDALPRGARVTLRASWPSESAERYVVYDLASRTLVDHRESLRVSWFATAGSFAADRTGRAEEELETSTENVWVAPDSGSAHLFVVLRDARGGVAFTTLAANVR